MAWAAEGADVPAPKSPQQIAEEEALAKWKADKAAGQTEADKTFATGTMGTLTDKYKTETDANLARLQAGANGMTEQEMQAAREQGRSEIDRQLAGNMRRLGGAAAANGVRGASGAGLMARATSDAQSASGDLGRKLVLDNLNQKNIGSAAYTGALGTQQNFSMGIDKQNQDWRNAELYGRTTMPGQLADSMSAVRAGGAANYFSQKQLEQGDAALASANKAADSVIKPGSAADVEREDNIAVGEEAVAQKTRTRAEDKIATTTGGVRNQWREKGVTQPGCAAGVYCYIMTSALNQGLIEPTFYAATTTKCPTKRKYAQAYTVWGPVMAGAMDRSRTFARLVAWCLPELTKKMRGQPAALRGVLFYYGVCGPLSILSNLYLRLTDGR